MLNERNVKLVYPLDGGNTTVHTRSTEKAEEDSEIEELGEWLLITMSV